MFDRFQNLREGRSSSTSNCYETPLRRAIIYEKTRKDIQDLLNVISEQYMLLTALIIEKNMIE
jgi:hypothetical protein